MQNTVILVLWSVLLITCLPACDSSQTKHYPAAPLDNKQALENLAKSYESVSESIPVNPINLRPSARKKFVEEVFTAAGYSYSDTLQALSTIQASAVSKYHKDMQQLLFLPHYRVDFEDIKDIYTAEEIQAIEKINSKIRPH